MNLKIEDGLSYVLQKYKYIKIQMDVAVLSQMSLKAFIHNLIYL